jgi:hypothetical protein
LFLLPYNQAVSSLPVSQGRTARGSSARWFLFLGLPVLAVVALSFLPPQDKVELHTKGHFHYIGHAAVFGGLAVLLIGTARTGRGRLFAYVAALGSGFVIEFAQHLIYSEPVEWTDVLVDSAAVVLASLFASLLFARRRPSV